MSAGRHPKPKAKDEKQTSASGSASLFSSFSSAPAPASQNNTATAAIASTTDAKSTVLTVASGQTEDFINALPALPYTSLLPHELWRIVEGYFNYETNISFLNYHHSIFREDDVASIYRKAYAIARDHVLKADGKPAKSKATIVVVDEKNPDAPPPPADPFAALDAAVIADPRVLLPQITITVKRDGVDHTFQGTLETISMANLGHTVASINPNKPMVSEGRAERLRWHRERQLPYTVPLALEQARLALPKQQDAKAVAAKNKALNDAFDKVKQGKPAEAQEILEAYVKSTKPAVITDGSYYIDLLQTYIDGLNILLDRGKELEGNWCGPKGDEYFRALGRILRPFSMDLREVLMTSAWNILREGQPVDRGQDTSDTAFIGAAGSALEVGVSGSYDDFGRVALACFGGGAVRARTFQTYVSNYNSAATLMLQSNTQSQQQPESLTLSNPAKAHSRF